MHRPCVTMAPVACNGIDAAASDLTTCNQHKFGGRMGSDVDVVVVGAGAAGLAAARALLNAGRTVLVLEAADRPGGRAWTDTTTFPGIPFDRGCHWLHSASVNPMRAIADQLGMAYDTKPRPHEGRLVFERGRGQLPIAERTSWAAVMAAFAAMRAAGEAGQDVAGATVIHWGGRWDPLVRNWIGLFSSADPSDLSTLDLARYSDTDENWPVIEGYGALVLAAHGDALPVRLSTPVRAIDLGGAGVRVTTDTGTIRAQAVIVTASTSVLAAGGICFTPELPVALSEAIAACPLGHAEKIAFQLDQPLGEFDETTYSDMFDPSGELHPLVATINEAGRALISCAVAGDFARDLTAQGPEAVIAYGRAALAGALGAGILKRIVRQTSTAWGTDPLIRGAYSYARPGRADLRQRLSEVVMDRLFLAGEAVSLNAFSTAHGAHLTGQDAARRAVAMLGRSG